MPTRYRSLWMALLSVALLAPGVAGAQGFRVVTLAEELAHPWGMAFLPDGRMLVTERPGRLRLIENGRLLAEPVGGLPRRGGHRGGARAAPGAAPGRLAAAVPAAAEERHGGALRLAPGV